MSRPSVRSSRLLSLAAIAILSALVLAVASGIVLPSVAATGPTEDATPAPIDDELTAADGTVSVLVRFEPFEDPTESREDAIDDRKAHAAATQEPFERYANATAGVEVDRGFWITNAALVTVDTDAVALSELARVENVTGIHIDERVSGSATAVASPEVSVSSDGRTEQPQLQSATGGTAAPAATEDPQYTDGLEQIRVPEAWDGFNTRGEDVTIAVLDSGVDGDHPDITVDGWRDFSEAPSDEPIDYDGHGTQVSGIAVGGNASGTHIGVAPDATLLHGAVMTDCAERCGGTSSTILAGVEWALQQDVDVISLSLGWDGHSRASVAAIENAEAVGTVVVGATGNGGEGTSLSPGNAYDVISVGAADRSDGVPTFSGGEEIDTADEWRGDAPDHWSDAYAVPDVVAPGVGVKSATPGGDYRSNLGTSLAAPHVAGTVALVQSATDEELAPAEIRRALAETAWKPEGKPAEKDTRYGDGIVDAYAAIDAVGEHATIEGTVEDAVTGASLSNASVELVAADGSEYRTKTDADGEFAITGLTGEQEYAITVANAGYETATETRAVPADETTTVDVALAGDWETEVGVTDAHFEDPIETATVDLNGTYGTYPGTYVDDSRYRIEDVPTTGDYVLGVSAAGYEDETRSVTAGVATADAPADQPDESVALRGDGTLEITVDATDGEPIENATVSVARESGSAFEPAATTDEDGVLAVTVPGTGAPYSVEVGAAGFETATVETDSVESGSTEAVAVTLSAASESIVGLGVLTALIAMLAIGLGSVMVGRDPAT